MTRSTIPAPRAHQNHDIGLASQMAALLSLEIPADCRTGLLANFDLLRAHGQKLEAGIKAAKLRIRKASRPK